MAVRERASFLASKDCKIVDDKYIHFGTRASKSDLGTWDTKLGYSSALGGLALDCFRAAATSPSYNYGFYVNGGSDQFFAHTGANKSRLAYLGGTRLAAVAGGDSNDMLLDIGYTNEAVNSPAGHYARGLSVSLNNKTAGAITSLQGGFISVRQRSTGAANTIRGLQIDTKVDSGKLAPDTAIEGLRVDMNVPANAPAASYGVVVRNLTDGYAYTIPTAAFKAYNDGTGSCKGFTYGLDLYGADARTALADIRLASADSDALAGLILSGAGTDDGTIQADLTARGISAAHGSLYLSIVKGAGSAWSNKNGTWTVVV